MSRFILIFFLVWIGFQALRFVLRRQQAFAPRAADAGGSVPMNEARALEVLGLQANATRQEVVEAHKRLAKKVHPDQGGSNYLAAEINRARDVLLGRR